MIKLILPNLRDDDDEEEYYYFDDDDDENPNYPSTTGNPSGGGRGNTPK